MHLPSSSADAGLRHNQIESIGRRASVAAALKAALEHSYHSAAQSPFNPIDWDPMPGLNNVVLGYASELNAQGSCVPRLLQQRCFRISAEETHLQNARSPDCSHQGWSPGALVEAGGEEVIKQTLREFTLMNGQSALTLYGDHTHVHINLPASSSSAAPMLTPALQHG